ncbi:hypothetical protein CPB84DRAFT_1752542 [Gymnopilus junonius]|uniref:Uncharacterized protein n=1 Tax=Gymnopilus junonius TaxID=109634 RepID=A0A9P5TGT7_GYMJU|nr:hypothetical protein CPB84DRAFT_1752542 [Gymnopilus junonius]
MQAQLREMELQLTQKEHELQERERHLEEQNCRPRTPPQNPRQSTPRRPRENIESHPTKRSRHIFEEDENEETEGEGEMEDDEDSPRVRDVGAVVQKVDKRQADDEADVDDEMDELADEYRYESLEFDRQVKALEHLNAPRVQAKEGRHEMESQPAKKAKVGSQPAKKAKKKDEAAPARPRRSSTTAASYLNVYSIDSVTVGPSIDRGCIMLGKSGSGRRIEHSQLDRQLPNTVFDDFHAFRYIDTHQYIAMFISEISEIARTQAMIHHLLALGAFFLILFSTVSAIPVPICGTIQCVPAQVKALGHSGISVARAKARATKGLPKATSAERGTQGVLGANGKLRILPLEKDMAKLAWLKLKVQQAKQQSKLGLVHLVPQHGASVAKNSAKTQSSRQMHIKTKAAANTKHKNANRNNAAIVHTSYAGVQGLPVCKAIFTSPQGGISCTELFLP